MVVLITADTCKTDTCKFQFRLVDDTREGSILRWITGGHWGHGKFNLSLWEMLGELVGLGWFGWVWVTLCRIEFIFGSVWVDLGQCVLIMSKNKQLQLRWPMVCSLHPFFTIEVWPECSKGRLVEETFELIIIAFVWFLFYFTNQSRKYMLILWSKVVRVINFCCEALTLLHVNITLDLEIWGVYYV